MERSVVKYRLEMKDDKRGERQRGIESPNTLRNLNIRASVSCYVVRCFIGSKRDSGSYSYLFLFELHLQKRKKINKQTDRLDYGIDCK